MFRQQFFFNTLENNLYMQKHSRQLISAGGKEKIYRDDSFRQDDNSPGRLKACLELSHPMASDRKNTNNGLTHNYCRCMPFTSDRE
jgi:hypothetical protein